MTVHTPRSLTEAASLLASHPDSHLLTGGTDLMVEVNFNRRRPASIIALRKVDELVRWTIDAATGTVRIGAGVPYADMETGALAEALPALAAAARTVGSPQIRAAGSIGGNLGTCSPAGDSLPVLSALDAVVHLVSSAGEREISIHDFMVGPKRNARQPDEIIASVTLPVADGWQGYSKVGVRNAMVISVASACLAWQNGLPRLALGSVGPTVIRCRETEQWVVAQGITPDSAVDDTTADEIGKRAAAEARPIDDHRSTAAYRRHAIAVLSRRLFQRSTAR